MHFRHFQPSFFSFHLPHSPSGTLLFNASVSYFHIFFLVFAPHTKLSKGSSSVVKPLKKVTHLSYLALIPNPSGNRAHAPSLMKYGWARSCRSRVQISTAAKSWMQHRVMSRRCHSLLLTSLSSTITLFLSPVRVVPWILKVCYRYP